MNIETDKYHPACWHKVEGRWRMTRDYWLIWSDYQKRNISKATFYRKKAALKAAYDALASP